LNEGRSFILKLPRCRIPAIAVTKEDRPARHCFLLLRTGSYATRRRLALAFRPDFRPVFVLQRRLDSSADCSPRRRHGLLEFRFTQSAQLAPLMRKVFVDPHFRECGFLINPHFVADATSSLIESNRFFLPLPHLVHTPHRAHPDLDSVGERRAYVRWCCCARSAPRTGATHFGGGAGGDPDSTARHLPSNDSARPASRRR
jgi:hypothetical protein